MRRHLFRAFWRVVNPLTRPLAGLAPWWVLLETTGNRTGLTRTTPLAAGPTTGNEMLFIAVHGRSSGWVRNVLARPEVRMKHRRKWYDAVASVEEFDREVARTFNLYARMGPPIAGIDPVIVRVRY